MQRHYVVHIVNVGNFAARAASWRYEQRGNDRCTVDRTVRDLPGTIAPGADLEVAVIDRGEHRDRRQRAGVDVIVRWVQPSGAVAESVQRFN